MTRRVAQQRNNGGIQFALLGQALVQLAQFGAGRQLSEPEQVAGLLKIRVVRQFMDVDAAIGEYPAISVDVANLGIGGNDSLKSLGGMSCGQAGHYCLASIAGFFVGGAREEGRGECNLFLYLKRRQVSNRPKVTSGTQPNVPGTGI